MPLVTEEVVLESVVVAKAIAGADGSVILEKPAAISSATICDTTLDSLAEIPAMYDFASGLRDVYQSGGFAPEISLARED